MRALTPAEKVVVGGLLSGATHSGASWRRGGGLARRTEQTVRQRVLARRWVAPTLLVDPAALGTPVVSVITARPYADRVRDLGLLWVSAPESVLVWESPDLFLGVFFSPSVERAARLQQRMLGQGLEHDSATLHTDSRRPAIPVWFDFESMWTRFAGLSAPARYPRGLPQGGATGGSGDREGLSSRERDALTELLSDPTGGSHRPPTKSERVLFRRVVVEQRYILDPMTVSGWFAGFPDGLVVVQGDFTADSRPSALFGALVRDAGIGPFLFAYSEERLLFATLSGPKIVLPKPVKEREGSVLSIVRNHLTNIRVDRAPLSSIRPLKSHVYADLLGGTDTEARA